jgi:hypothetical protein
MSSTPSRPLPPFSPASPYARPPPTSPHRRAPQLAILKSNVLALCFLVLLRLSPFYFSYRAVAFRTLGLSRDIVNGFETVVVTLLAWNAFAAARKLGASGGIAAGATLTASSSGRSLRSTPMSNKGSPKVRSPRAQARWLRPHSLTALRTSSPAAVQIRPAPASPSPLSLASSVSSTPTSSLRSSTSKPRFSLPASASPPSTPTAGGGRTLKQSLNSPPHAPSPLGGSTSSYRGSPLARSDGANDDIRPVHVHKMRASLGASAGGLNDSLRR